MISGIDITHPLDQAQLLHERPSKVGEIFLAATRSAYDDLTRR